MTSPPRRDCRTMMTTAALLLAMGSACDMPPEDLGPGGEAPPDLEELTNGLTEQKNPLRQVLGIGGHCRIETKIWSCTSPSQAEEQFVTCQVDKDYVAVGGGAWVEYGNGPGAMLTASYPGDDSLSSWKARSKAHGYASPHVLTTYAIGLRIQGVGRADLRKQMHLARVTSGTAGHPAAEANVPSGFVPIGGGARAEWAAGQAGNLLVSSVPTLRGWAGRAKDHDIPSAGKLSVWAIGIRPTVAGIALTVSYSAARKWIGGFPGEVHLSVPSHETVVGLGAATSFHGYGRMLEGMAPACGSLQEMVAAGKDHFVVDGGDLDLYAVTLYTPPARCPVPVGTAAPGPSPGFRPNVPVATGTAGSTPPASRVPVPADICHGRQAPPPAVAQRTPVEAMVVAAQTAGRVRVPAGGN